MLNRAHHRWQHSRFNGRTKSCKRPQRVLKYANASAPSAFEVSFPSRPLESTMHQTPEFDVAAVSIDFDFGCFFRISIATSYVLYTERGEDA